MRKDYLLLTVALFIFACALVRNATMARVLYVPPGGNLQAAIDDATWGDTILLEAGASYDSPVPFRLTNKGTPPADTDEIVITTTDPTGIPQALFEYPVKQTLITPEMAAKMPKLRTTSAEPILDVAAGANHWHLKGVEIANVDTGVNCVRLIASDARGEIRSLADYPNKNVFEQFYAHPAEETGAPLSPDNIYRTAWNGIYFEGTNTVIRQFAAQGFVGRIKYGSEAGQPMPSAGILIGSYSKNITVENFQIGAWTYAFFIGGSGMPDWLVTGGAKVVSCSGNPTTSCTFDNVAGLQVGAPLSVFVSTSTSGNKWGASFVESISGNTVTFRKPLCQSFNGGNSCTDQNGTPVTGDRARWDGVQPTNITFRRGVFAHYDEWTTLLNGNCGGKGYGELKAGINVTIEGNIFSKCTGITITVRNQSGDFPWAALDGLKIDSNVAWNSNQFFTGFFQDAVPTRRSKNISYTNNLLMGLVTKSDPPGGVLSGNFQGADDVTIAHNTVLWSKTSSAALNAVRNYYQSFVSFVAAPVRDLKIQDNIFGAAPNFCWDAPQTLTLSITQCWPGATVSNNVLINSDGYSTEDVSKHWLTPYPNNSLVSVVDSIGFVRAPDALDNSGDYRLGTDSPFKGRGSDGKDPGVDFDILAEKLSFDINTGISLPTPTPTPTPTPKPTSTPTPTPVGTPLTVSADGTSLPPATQIVDAGLNVWTLNGTTMLKSGADSGGRGSLLLWYSRNIYAIGVDGNWWMYIGGMAWVRVAGDPTQPLATPTPTPTPVPSPSPSPSPTPFPTPTPTPEPRCRKFNPKGKCVQWSF